MERFAKAFFVVCIQTNILRIKRGVYFIIKIIYLCAKCLLKQDKLDIVCANVARLLVERLSHDEEVQESEEEEDDDDDDEIDGDVLEEIGNDSESEEECNDDDGDDNDNDDDDNDSDNDGDTNGDNEGEGDSEEDEDDSGDDNDSDDDDSDNDGDTNGDNEGEGDSDEDDSDDGGVDAGSFEVGIGDVLHVTKSGRTCRTWKGKSLFYGH